MFRNPKCGPLFTCPQNDVPVNPEKSTGFCCQTHDSKPPFLGSPIKTKSNPTGGGGGFLVAKPALSCYSDIQAGEVIGFKVKVYLLIYLFRRR